MEIGKKILVIEDEESITRLFKKVLNLEDYNVLTADNGLKGIDTYKSNLDIKKVFCDTDVGAGMNGMETTARLRKIADENNRVLDITLMSGRIIEKPDYVDEFLQKPIMLEQIYKSAGRPYKK